MTNSNLGGRYGVRSSCFACGWSDGSSVNDRIPRQSNQHNTEKQEKERLVTEIRNTLPDDGVFVSDTSFTGAFTACYYEVRKTGRTYLQHRGMAGIGYGRIVS